MALFRSAGALAAAFIAAAGVGGVALAYTFFGASFAPDVYSKASVVLSAGLGAYVARGAWNAFANSYDREDKGRPVFGLPRKPEDIYPGAPASVGAIAGAELAYDFPFSRAAYDAAEGIYNVYMGTHKAPTIAVPNNWVGDLAECANNVQQCWDKVQNFNMF